MFEQLNTFLETVDDLVWNIPLIALILTVGIFFDGPPQGTADHAAAPRPQVYGKK